ncbi:MAG: hypothetical protein KGO02_24535 [Alphaproteobacteria bacterium]|nr:hypothetical protein [Alphaproteobacteria bacterium]
MTGPFTRRTLLVTGTGAALGLGTAAALTYGFGLWRRPWPSSPYDDLLERLPVEDGATVLGQAVQKALPGLHDGTVAAQLRRRLNGTSLRELVRKDAAERQVVTISGWIMPRSVAEICALAASTAAA